MDQDQVKKIAGLSFAGLFIWMVLGVFLGQYVGKIMQYIYFGGTILGFFYIKNKYKIAGLWSGGGPSIAQVYKPKKKDKL